MLKISDAGIALIKEYEGCRLTAYPDPASGGIPFTVGYGHTKGVYPGMVITQDEADAFLRTDLETFEFGVNQLVGVPITQSQFDALVSFAFNLGCGNLRRSTLLIKLNSGDDVGASLEFLKWDRAAGRQMAGLTRRREAERAMFLS